MFGKSGAGKNRRDDNGKDVTGQSDDTEVQTRLWNEKKKDIPGPNDDRGMKTPVWVDKGKDFTGQNDDAAVNSGY